jgi:hypothetical protein
MCMYVWMCLCVLDNFSDRIVQQSLDHIMKGRTTIVIAHRLRYVDTYICVCLCMYACMYVCVCLLDNVCVCVCVCVCVLVNLSERHVQQGFKQVKGELRF